MEKKKKGVLLPHIWKHKFSYIIGLLTLLIVDYCNLYIPQITSEITDGLTSFTLDLQGVLKLVITLIVLSLFVALGRILWRQFIFGASRKVETEIRNDLFEHLETLTQTYFNKHKTGDLMANFTNDIEALRNSIGPAVISCFDAIVLTAMVLYKMMVYVDVRLTLMTLVPMGLIAIGSYYFGGAFEKRYSKKQ